jgi:hypothetical protein
MVGSLVLVNTLRQCVRGKKKQRKDDDGFLPCLLDDVCAGLILLCVDALYVQRDGLDEISRQAEACSVEQREKKSAKRN